MNVLDQAFFKAYMQVEAASAGGPLVATRTIQLEEALVERPDPKTSLAAPKASLDSVLAALSKPPARPKPVAASPSPTPPLSPEAKTSSEEVGEPATVSAGSVPAFLRSGAGIRPSGPKEKNPAATVPTLTELELPEAVYRVDQGKLPSAKSALAGQPVPPPHLSIVAPEGAEDAADTATDEPAEYQAAQSATVATGVAVFRPMLQVDRFTWPRTCTRLMEAAAGELDQLTEQVTTAQARGQKILAIAGCRRGEGSTTILLCMARRLAERGLRVVMVDADLAEPQLARRLGVLPQFGWESVWSGRLPLAEVVVESTENRLALLPLCEAFTAAGPGLDGRTILAESIDTLRANFELVLVDMGPLEDPAALGGTFGREISRRLDAVILVENVRLSARARMAEVQRRLASAGIAQAGIVENLVRD